MRIILKNKETLLYDDFKFKCAIGKSGITKKKKEGDNKTPKGVYFLGPLYYRKDRLQNHKLKLSQFKYLKNFLGVMI